MDISQDSEEFANDAVEIGVLDSETSQQILDVVSVGAAPSNVTLTINAKGEVNVDQTALAELLGSEQKSARVTFVRIGEDGATVENQVDLDASELLQAVGGEALPPVAGESMNPMLLLDPDQMSRLESVLQSDEARNFLEEAMTTDEQTADETQDEEEGGKLRTQTRRSQRRQQAVAQPPPAKASTKSSQKAAVEAATPVGPKKRTPPGSRKRANVEAAGDDEPGSASSRPVRQRRLPAGLQDSHVDSPTVKLPKKGPGVRPGTKAGAVAGGSADEKKNREDEEQGYQMDEEEEDDDSGESWASEDDPDRLWCICKRPHNNRFMICCDICLDWFHGKCVGITKGKGKEMEEAGIDWKCPTCKQQVQDSSAQPIEIDRQLSPPAVKEVDAPAVVPSRVRAKPTNRRRKSSETQEKPKPKGPRCHMCSNPPRQSSIYCSDGCIKAHAAQALKLLKESNANKSNNTVVVLEPKTNTLLNGPNAPTQEKLQDWLAEHTSYHVVMPSQSSSAKFYAERRQKAPRMVDPHRMSAEDLAKRRHSSGDATSIGLLGKKLEKPRPGPPTTPAQPRPKLLSKEEIQAEVKAQLKKAISRSGEKPSKTKRERRQSESRTPVKRRPKEPKEEPPKEEPKAPDTRLVRSKVVKAVRDALHEKVEKCKDLSIEFEKIQKIAEEIEIAMFGTFGDVGAKYKNKYRSLVYNIKDVKNDGLFRRILLRDLSPIEVVNMSAEEYASKELHEWREATMKKDIEAIKSHELDLLALGNVYVMKSHKGEQVIEKEDNKETVVEIKLPEDIAYEDSKVEGSRTWDHPDHGDVKVEPLCDVCNGKMSLETFVNIKISKEKQVKKEKRSRSRSRDRHKHHRHKSSSSRHPHTSHDKEKSSHHKDKHSGHKEHRGKDQSSVDRDKSSHKEHRDKDRSSVDRDRSAHKEHRDKDRSSVDRDRSSKVGKTDDRDRSKGKEGHMSGEHRHDSSSRDKERQSSESGSGHNKDRHSHRSSEEKKSHKLRERRSSPKQREQSSSKRNESQTSSADKKDLQEKIEKATAAIEAAKKSGEEFNKVLEEKMRQRGSTPSPPNSPDLELELGLPAPPIPVPRSSEAEVSSTVNIKTPEFTESEPPFSPEEESLPEPPFSPQGESAWRGGINMQDVAKFNVSAHEVRGPADYLDEDIGEHLDIVGRIPPPVVWDYMQKIMQNQLKEVLLLRLDARPGNERNYGVLYSYLATRDRFGVVGNANKKTVKDCYVLPLAGRATIPATLQDLGADLPVGRPDSLLCMIVRTKRDRGNGMGGTPSITPSMPSTSTNLRPLLSASGPVHKSGQYRSAPPPPPLAFSTPTAASSGLISRTVARQAPSPQQPSLLEDEEPYEPEDEEPYSPGNSPPGSSGPTPGYTTGRILPTGGDSPQLLRVKTSDEGGFTEQLKKLQAEVDAKKLELARREAMRDTLLSGTRMDYPPPHPPRQIERPDYQVSNAPAFCTDVVQPAGLLGISGMTAKMPIIPPIGMPVVPGMPKSIAVSGFPLVPPELPHAKLLTDHTSRPLPPPGPGMPGNEKGQGVHNLELQREQEERLRGRQPWPHHQQDFPRLHHPHPPPGFRGRGHPPPWRGGGEGRSGWAGKRRPGGPLRGAGNWRDRRERDRREREWEEEEERERHRRRRRTHSRSRSRSRSKSRSTRRSRSRSRSRDERSRRIKPPTEIGNARLACFPELLVGQ